MSKRKSDEFAHASHTAEPSDDEEARGTHRHTRDLKRDHAWATPETKLNMAYADLFEATKRHEPNVLDELADLMPLHEACDGDPYAGKFFRAQVYDDGRWSTWGLHYDESEFTARERSLVDAIRAWQKRWKLQGDEVFYHVLWLLHWWRVLGPEAVQARFIPNDYSGPGLPRQQLADTAAPDFRPDWGMRRSDLKSPRDAKDKEREGQMPKVGYEPIGGKHARPALPAHMDWLVQSRILGMTDSEIADRTGDPNLDVNSVRRARERMAHYLRLA